MNRKKGAALLLVVGLTLSVIGCGKNGEEAGDNGKNVQNTSGEGAQTAVPLEIEGNYYAGTYEKIPDTNLGKVTVYSQYIYYLMYDKADNYRCLLKQYDMESKQVTEVSVPVGEEESIEALAVNNEGNLLIGKANWSGEGEQVPYTIGIYKPDGSVILEKEVTDLLKDSEIPYLYHVQAVEDKVAFTNGKEVWVINQEGELLFSVPSDFYIESMGVLPGDKLGCAVYEGESMKIKVLDMEKKAWGETYASERFGNSISFTENTESGIYFWNSSELYSYDPESGETKVVANWLTNDILADNIQYVSVLEDGSIRLVLADATGTGAATETALLEKKDAGEVAQKQILTLGTIETSVGLRKGAIAFNRANEKYRIEIIEYANGTDYEEGANRLKNEITAGNIPDILNITDGSQSSYAAKGLLEDLKPYMDGENGINRADYFDNVLTAMETDGKVYAIFPDFYIDTMVGKTELVGEGFNWTMEDMMKLEETRPDGVEMFDHETKMGVLDCYLKYNLEEYFNLNEGFCEFNTEEFKKILEFCNRFPTENEQKETDASSWRKASEGELLLMNEGITGLRDYQMCHNIFGTDISFVGYPSNGQCGSVAKSAQMTFAMSSKCADKDAAWEFIRYFLEEDYQKGSYYLPLLRSAFDAKAEEEMEVAYETNENGEKVETATYVIGTNDFTLEVYAAKKEEVEAVKTLIEKLERVERVDEQVLSIITEEAGAYFEGQKTVEDVIQVVQSRANIYMNENR